MGLEFADSMSVAQFDGFLKECDKWDMERKRFQNDLFTAYQKLEDAYRTKCMDLESEKRSRIHFQSENSRLEGEVQKVMSHNEAEVQRMNTDFYGALIQASHASVSRLYFSFHTTSLLYRIGRQ